MKTPAQAEQERREAVISAVAEQLEQWFPGKGRKVAEALSEQIARRRPTRIEWAAQDIHVEIALDYNLGPEDPDPHLFGPGGWHIDCAVDLHVDGHVLQPEVLGWRRERVPDWPDSEGIAPDWACEVLEHTPQAEPQKLRALYARAGVEQLWIADLSTHTITAWRRDGDGYAPAGTASRGNRARLAPFERTPIRPRMIGL